MEVVGATGIIKWNFTHKVAPTKQSNLVQLFAVFVLRMQEPKPVGEIHQHTGPLYSRLTIASELVN